MRTGRRPLIKEVGIGSSEQDFELPESIIFDSFSTVMLANDLNCCASVIDVSMFIVHYLFISLFVYFIICLFQCEVQYSIAGDGLSTQLFSIDEQTGLITLARPFSIDALGTEYTVSFTLLFSVSLHFLIHCE